MKAGWTYKKLGEVVKPINGLWKGKKEPFVHVGVIRNANFTKDFTLNFDNIEYLDVEQRQYATRKLKKGDLIVEKSGGSEKQPVGRAVLFLKDEGEFSFSNFTSVLRITDANSLSYLFLYKYLLFVYKRGDTKKMQNAATGIHNIIWDMYLGIDVPIPAISEQERIVAYLDTQFAKIDAMKANAAKALAEAKALFQAALTEAMTPKEGWMMKKIDDIALNMFRGAGIKREQVTETGTPCVRYGEIYTTYDYSFNECVSHTNEDEIKPKKYFEHGDLLFTLTGESIEDIGKCIAYLGHERCLLGGDILVMKHEQNPKFLAYALSTENARKQKGLGKVKLKVVHTNESSLRSVVIPLPSLSEQQAIVEHLDSLHAHLKALEANYPIIVAECDALKQALLREVFE